MWNTNDAEQDTLAVIPDSSYAGVYSATVEDCQNNGAFDPTTMGTVPNVGLMAQKAEEYGSHDKTFEIAADGRVEVRDASGTVAHEPRGRRRGHLPRLPGQGRPDPRLGPAGGAPLSRVRDARGVLARRGPRPRPQPRREGPGRTSPMEDTDGLDIQILAPIQATEHTLARVRRGEDTISVTGNVLRDYLTDLFPIMELGTSAKMLSVVPLMNGGGLFETGAGGSAPKHVQQLIEEDYLRWDSLGEFLALAESLRHLAGSADNARAAVLADALDRATETLLNEGKSPQRKLGSIDNRGSHFYLAMYWAQELAAQSEDSELAAAFGPIAKELTDGEQTIAEELLAVQGEPADIGGYYRPDLEKTSAVMRPSATFNRILEEISAAL